MNLNALQKKIAILASLALLATPFASYAQPSDGSLYPDSASGDYEPNWNMYWDTYAPQGSSGTGSNTGSAAGTGPVMALPASGSKSASQPASGSKTAGSLLPGATNSSGGQVAAQNGNQTVSSAGYEPLTNPLKGVNSISDLILTFMKIVSYLAVIFGVIMLMWVGLQLVLAQGKPDEIKKRTNELLWVVIGIGLIIGARIIVTVVINTLQATGTVNPAIIQNAQNAINSQ